jgi:hypothetical protein
MTVPFAPVRPRRPVGLIVLVSVLAALLTATLCLAGVVRFAGPGPKTVPAVTNWPNGGARGAVQAAEDCVAHFFDITEENVAEDMQRVLDCATGTFAEEYESGRAELETAVRENHVHSTAEIITAAVVKAARDSATVLVAADARVKNVNSPDGRTVHYRVQVDMSLVNGEWKVATLRFVA